MFLRLFPSRLKYQQTHIHREKFMVHQVCMIHAWALTRLRCTGCKRNVWNTHTRAVHAAPRLPDPEGHRERAEAERKTAAGEQQYFTLVFDLHGKSILVVVSKIPLGYRAEPTVAAACPNLPSPEQQSLACKYELQTFFLNKIKARWSHQIAESSMLRMPAG